MKFVVILLMDLMLLISISSVIVVSIVFVVYVGMVKLCLRFEVMELFCVILLMLK